jgi:uncharacterized protein (UPF0335 family)
MSIDGKRLRGIVECYERLEDQRKEAQDDQAQLLNDAENDGFDKKAIKRLIRYLRDAEAAKAEQDVFDDYLAAYMDFESTPLSQAAAKREAERSAEPKLVDEIAAE